MIGTRLSRNTNAVGVYKWTRSLAGAKKVFLEVKIADV